MRSIHAARTQEGFTLIELITVIIILGVLAAVVAPRYFNMADQAREQTGAEALAEAVVHFNLAFMKYVVDNKSAPDDLAALADVMGLDGSGRIVSGDYRFTYVQNGDVTVTGERNDGGSWVGLTDASGVSMSRTFPMP